MTNNKPITPRQFVKDRLNIRTLELPSGITVKVKDVDLESMVTLGYLPASLLSSLMSSGFKIKANQAGKKSELDGVKEEDIANADTLFRKFAVVAILEPKTKHDGDSDDDAININDFSFTDCVFVFTECVRGGASQFAPFPGKKPLRNSSGQNVPKVRAKTVRNDGNTGPTSKD